MQRCTHPRKERCEITCIHAHPSVMTCVSAASSLHSRDVEMCGFQRGELFVGLCSFSTQLNSIAISSSFVSRIRISFVVGAQGGAEWRCVDFEVENYVGGAGCGSEGTNSR